MYNLIAQIHYFSQYQYFIDPANKKDAIYSKNKRFVNKLHCIFLQFDLLLQQTLKSDWLVCLVSVSHWLGKRCDLEQKIVRFVNKSHC